MKTIEVDEDLYRYIAGQTQHIGESASDILRRLLHVPAQSAAAESTVAAVESTLAVPAKPIVVGEPTTQARRSINLESVLNSSHFTQQSRVIGRFMMILTALYQQNPQAFSDAAAIKGRTRVYFADNAQTLLANGNTTKPKQIPETPFWVITNTNTGRKRQMIIQMMQRMGYGEEECERIANAI
ncbi:Negative modulator of initiation of replication [Vibrio stylophorae]|uniref:Negative modulator of initiation of replication n=1 Tax=Vibrio stylophorae TaxID=659351 RepID=A0ABM8ZU95_9VIBR|nr:replication initiation negative regulator SeqA [Vibrio stylophorae]CAH0533889.1 Negative modulator of initiation of replication [Vibrio stylophorae]